jgi:AbrB family looped-hinge helix DNA binding protein
MARMTNRSTLTKKSQVTLPKQVREVLEVGPGDQIAFEVKGGEVKVHALRSVLDANYGSVKPRKRPEDFRKIREEMERVMGREVAEKDG